MDDKLDKKTIKIEHGCSNKKSRLKKPWWNEELSALWNETYIKERDWLRAKSSTVKKMLNYFYFKTKRI